MQQLKHRRGYLPNAIDALRLLRDRLVDRCDGVDGTIYANRVAGDRSRALLLDKSLWHYTKVVASQCSKCLVLECRRPDHNIVIRFFTDRNDDAATQAEAMFRYLCDNDVVSVKIELK